MLKKTVYFRTQEDLERFNAIGNKAEWLHEHLKQSSVSFKVTDEGVFTSVDGKTTGYAGRLPSGDVGIVKAKAPYTICEHYQPKGSCLVKGCKFGKGKK